MEALAIQKKATNPTYLVPVLPKPRPKITWEEFQKRYLDREDAYKYEWVNGEVEKTKRTMDWTQFPILTRLQRIFANLNVNNKVDGYLITEGDTFFLENHRRPDIAWYSEEQITNIEEGVRPTPTFVIEVISNNDAMNKVHKKMQDYREAGVQVVWHILPQFEEVHVYTGKDLDSMKVCSGAKICSANPVLPDFEFPAQHIF